MMAVPGGRVYPAPVAPISILVFMFKMPAGHMDKSS
ncbi:hypothetical protein L284_17770 [Novosphingobium lindaniclasticum LE124]|uniref:Uncharacterized protein n=1 Tax=Novosphingobium lindaniclasticum LE124 TaxID=1096930 RepID=T0HDT9_9SPHN|nr:hypothetical protein L284_17770 [Novosphingobium lindaniclasticum LE124]